MKRSCIPFEVYPIFSCNETEDDRWPQSIQCPPHAFVHFASCEVANEACVLADREMLTMGRHVLKIVLSTEALGLMHRTTSSVPCLKLSSVTVEVGTLFSPTELLVSWKGPSTGVIFELDRSKKRCLLFLTQLTYFKVCNTGESIQMRCNYQLEFLVRDIWEVRREKEWDGDGTLALIVQFRTPPRIYYRTADDDIYHATSFDLPDDDDPWIRTLDFTPDKSIGRCQAYRISVSPRQRSQFQKILEYFTQQQLLKKGEQARVRLPYEVKTKHQRSTFFLVPNDRNLPFKVIFLVNGLVHKGIIKAPNLSAGFYNLLDPSVTETTLAVFALNHIYSYKSPVFDAERRLKKVIDWLQNKTVPIPTKSTDHSTMEVGRFIITPTKAYCYSYEVELSNRVLREYNKWADRFLRVSFLDENFHPLSASTLNATVPQIVRPTPHTSRTALLHRVKSILLDGFELCGRHYSFLAFSSSQLRDHSAWFFASVEGVNVDTIRAWMGSFKRTNVAKYAARMGQCFSSTIPTLRFPFNEVKQEDDILRNGFNFSDGIGKIAPSLALECAKALKLEDNPPSAYQIRYAGYKGVVVTWPLGPKDKHLLTLRDSMKKFISSHDVVEVVNWTRFLPCFLNRQIITLLSALGVQNEVFIRMQDMMVNKLNQVLDSPEVAFEVLSMYCSGDLHTTALAMLSAGFHPLCEPHLKSMLQSIRASYLEEVLSKARIYVEDGRWLMGCMDELGVLEYGECFVQVSTPIQEDYFNGHSGGVQNMKHELKVITGKVTMAKNPCLHPGDIRILQAVDNPALHHLVDCFVMPQKGDRPHSNEASGSDLDGDLYFVCWDPDLIPPNGQSWKPMEYVESETRDGRSNMNLVEFFVRHMVNDHLGKICNAHVVHADQSEQGALDPKCLLLAELAATAVDSPKTGKMVILPPHLRPKIYPDFMDKEDKPSYRSKKILGILFRRLLLITEREIKANCQAEDPDIFYDPDLIVEGFENYVPEAWDLKQIYDERLRALMDQFDVKVESEVVTGHFTTFPLNFTSRRRGDLKDRLKWSYSTLRKEFRERFEENVSEEEEECKASAWYHVTYHLDYVQKMKEADLQDFSKVYLISFPWIAVETLSRLKLRKRRAYESYHKLIQSFGSFVDIKSAS